MKKTTKKKKVKVWAVYHKGKEYIGDLVYKTQKEAREDLLDKAYHHNPEVMKEALKNYRVIKVEIHYEL